MKNKTDSRPTVVWLLIMLQALLGVGALWGGGAFILAPDGRIVRDAMQMPPDLLKDMPFPDFLVPGILLFTVIGIYPLAVAFSLWCRPSWRLPNLINPFKQFHWSWAGSWAAGVAIIVWITAQVSIMKQIMSPHYLCWGWGIALIALTLLPQVRRYYTRKT